MFVNVDYNKRPKEAKIYLAKPNRQIISHIYEKINANLDIKYGNINELNFSIPFEIDSQFNDHVNTIKEKMLLKLVLGSYVEWYIVDSIEEDGDDTDLFNVKAFSLGYQLSHKKAVSSIDTNDTNVYKAEELLNNLLADTTWTVDEIDSIFNTSRSFEITDDQNILECILKMAETWNALIVWDTINKTISFKNIKVDGKYRGLTVKYGRLIKSIKRTRNTDEMVTRLYPYGNDGIGINSINPTGKGYIENFSYFLYPFEREPSVKKQFINMLVNGSFNNNLTNWNAVTSTTSVANGEISILPTAQYGRISQTIPNYVNYLGHIVYAYGRVKSTSNQPKIQLYDGVSYPNVRHSGSGDYESISVRATISSSATTLTFSVQDDSVSGWTTFYADNLMLIDLTTIFGVGNEPTKAFMDSLIAMNGWFDGTANLEMNLNAYEILKSSNYMTDDLAHILLDSIERTEANALQVKKLLYGDDLTGEQDGILFKNTLLVKAQSDLIDLQNQLQTQQDLYDTANLTNDTTGKAKATTEKNRLNGEISAKQSVVNGLNSYLTTKNAELQTLQTNMSFDKCVEDRFPNESSKLAELKEELQSYIIEKDLRDDNYIDEQDLYDGAIERFVELQQPKIVVEVDIDNLLNVIEEQYFWDKLTLGDLIKVKYPQMNLDFMAKIIEMKYDLTNMEVQLTVSNSKDLLNDEERLVKMIYNNSSASTTVNNNKSKWDKIDTVKNETMETMGFIQNEWDVTKNKIRASVNNSVEIGSRGIVVTDPTNSKEKVIIQSGMIALTEDDGDTWHTALTPKGVVGETIIGKIIAGQNLIITNNNNSFTIDEDGAVFDVDSFKLKSETTKSIKDVFGDYLNEATNGTSMSDFVTSEDLDVTSTNITASFSASGGGNNLKNSVGWADLTDKDSAYTYRNDLSKQNWFSVGSEGANNPSRLTTIQNDTMATLGFGSGFQFSKGINDVTLEQYIPVISGKTYTLSWYVDYKSFGSTDSFDIYIKEFNLDTNGNETGDYISIINCGKDDSSRNIVRSGINLGNMYHYDSGNDLSNDTYETQYITFIPTTNKVHLTLVAQKDCQATVTGLMMSMGGTPVQWTLANGEYYNTNVRQDINGIRVSQYINNKEVNYTSIAPDRLSGHYVNNNIDQEVFSVSKDITWSKKFEAENEITMGTVRVLELHGSRNGWAFVPIPSKLS